MLIGLTGGIGAGKSVVARILRLKGYPVYDCDIRARELMAESEYIQTSLAERFGETCIADDGTPDRSYLAQIVFSDDAHRQWLNALVHGEVRRDLKRWMEGKDICFVESAILRTSYLDRICDSIWLVTAPECVRIARAKERDHADDESIMRRIRAQRDEFEFEASDIVEIANDGRESLLAQIDNELKNIKI